MSEYSGTDYDPYLEATYSATAFDPTYKATITIDNTKVSDADSADLSNFPVLISGTYDGTGSEPDLRSTTNGGKIQSGAGYDIGFFSDSGLTTPLKYERELHNVATGAVSYWVKIPTLDYNNDTVIYMAYGDSVIMSNQEDKINVWNSNYVAVYHLKDNPNSKYVIDSTTNALNGTKRTAGGPAEATGIVNKGQQFDYSDKDYIDLTQNTLWNSNSLTVELFVYPTYYGDDNIVLSRDDETTRDWLLNTNTGWPTANRARFIGWNASGTLYKCVSDAQLTTNAWYHLVGRYDATANKLNMFVNGVKQTDDDDTSENIRQDAQQIQIGGFETATRYTSEGIYDEVRISNIARTDAWMITTYNAISSPSTFYAMGTETALTAGPTFIPKIWII
jgi:hypothetical protein